MKKPDSKDVVRATIRLPANLYLSIEEAAKYNGRSVNAEMVARLESVLLQDQLGKLLRELGEIKQINREILDTVADRPR
ncbi:MAG: Arc family DNA-binding protein [Massilia sp.]